MLALLALALATQIVAYYDGPRGYCSPFTARYLTLIDDVLVFHGGQGYILRPKRGRRRVAVVSVNWIINIYF